VSSMSGAARSAGPAAALLPASRVMLRTKHAGAAMTSGAGSPRHPACMTPLSPSATAKPLNNLEQLGSFGVGSGSARLIRGIRGHSSFHRSGSFVRPPRWGWFGSSPRSGTSRLPRSDSDGRTPRIIGALPGSGSFGMVVGLGSFRTSARARDPGGIRGARFVWHSDARVRSAFADQGARTPDHRMRGSAARPARKARASGTAGCS
jgi:hypothetical protein